LAESLSRVFRSVAVSLAVSLSSVFSRHGMRVKGMKWGKRWVAQVEKYDSTGIRASTKL